MPTRLRMRVGASALALASPLLSLPGASPASASPSVTSDGSAQRLLDAIPVLPKMTAGFTSAAYPSARTTAKDAAGCTAQARALIALASTPPQVEPRTCALRGGSWPVNFGTATVTDARDISFVPVISLPAAWASGGYGWSAEQRAAFAADYGSDRSVAAATGAPYTLSLHDALPI